MEELRIGDIETVEFIPNRNPRKKPICRFKNHIGFIAHDYRGAFIVPRSIWIVECTEIKKNGCIVVNPIDQVKTAKQNLSDIDKQISQLGTKHEPKHKKVKTKRFPYKSANERDK